MPGYSYVAGRLVASVCCKKADSDVGFFVGVPYIKNLG